MKNNGVKSTIDNKPNLGQLLEEENAKSKLRDDFAMAAMQGIMASGLADPRSKEHFDNIAKAAYRLADSMLEQREVYNNPITPQFPKDRQQP